MTTRETELLAANAALELEVVRLRNALKHIKYETDIHGNNLNRDIKDEAVKALSTHPFTSTALNELIETMITCKRCGKRGLQPDSIHTCTSKEVREQVERWEPRIGTPERKEWQEDENRKARARLDAIPIRERK